MTNTLTLCSAAAGGNFFQVHHGRSSPSAEDEEDRAARDGRSDVED